MYWRLTAAVLFIGQATLLIARVGLHSTNDVDSGEGCQRREGEQKYQFFAHLVISLRDMAFTDLTESCTQVNDSICMPARQTNGTSGFTSPQVIYSINGTFIDQARIPEVHIVERQRGLVMKKHSTVVGLFDDHTAVVEAIKELRQSGFSDDQIGFVVRHHDGSNTGDTATQGSDAVARGVVGGLLGAADALLLPVTGPGDASTMLGAALPATEEAIDNLPHPGSHKSQHMQSSFSADTIASATPVQETGAEQSEPVEQRSDILEKRGASIITGSVIGGTLGAVAAMLIPGIGPILAGGLLAATFGGAAIGGIAGGFLSIGIPEHKARYYEEQFHAGRIILTVKTDGQQQQALDILRRYRAQDVEAH